MIETKIKELVDRNTSEHNEIKDALNGKADKWVETAISGMRMEFRVIGLTTITTLLGVIGFLLIKYFEGMGG